MKLGVLMVGGLAACNGTFPSEMPIEDPAPLLSGVSTALVVPSACPIYTPTGSDTGTPEPAFPDQVDFYCGVTSTAGAYGLVTGDTGDLAVIAGNAEVGMYIDFAEDLEIDVESPPIKVWRAATNIVDHPLPESDDANLRPTQLVALGSGGMMLTFGELGSEPEQISVELFRDGAVAWWVRFYVNGTPP